VTKLTLVTDRTGKLIGAVQGHELSEKRADVEVQVSFLGEHNLHKIEVDFDIANISEDEDIEKKLSQYIPKG
jgi:hypothetical protein